MGEIFGGLFAVAQIATYIMSAIRWFSTDHVVFWHGVKELIWAVIPIVNFTYVWDWWFAAIMFVFAFVVKLITELWRDLLRFYA